MRSSPLALALALGLVAAPASASLIEDLEQISNNAVEDTRPRVAGGHVAWQRGPDTLSEIVRWEDGDTTDVTTSAFRDFAPELSTSFLIWKRSSDGTTCTLQVFDFDAAPRQLGSSFACADDIRVAGPHIGWIDDGIGAFDDVYVSTDLEDPEGLGRSNVDEAFVRVGNVAGAPRAVFIDEDDIVYWNGTMEEPIAPEPGSNALRAQLQMHGSRAVWVDVGAVGDDFEIFYFNGASVTQLSDNDYDDVEPRIHGTNIVWTGYPEDPAEGDIFFYDGSTTENLTNDDLDDFGPQVSEGADGPTIAWVKDDGDNDVWMFDGCESTRVNGDNAVDDDDVALDGNRVAWVRGSGSGQEIYTATVSCDVVCGNMETEADEECDDGNTVSEDGCSATCLLEICGNSRVDPGEECDDGNTVVEDGCDASCLLECGNGSVEPDEDCDDGERTNAGACDAQCHDNICGNGHLQPWIDEECDDGNLLPDDGCSAICEDEGPAPVAQQRCIQKLNESGAAVVKAQQGVDKKCLADAAKGVLATPQACLAADPNGKVAKAQAKTLSGEAKKCEAGDLPTFAYEGSAVVNAAGSAEPIAMMADLFGPDLDATFLAKAVDKQGARCQADTLKATHALVDRLFKLMLKEKKALLAGKEDGTLARSDAALQMQLEAFLTADAEGKIAKKETSLREAVRKSCANADLDVAFPGCAPSATLNDLADCATEHARCRFCRALDAMDGLALDCDAFDDATADASCP